MTVSFDVLEEHVKVRQMTPGRWSVAFRGIEKNGVALGPTGEEIARRAREAAAVAMVAFDLEQRYRRDRQLGTARGDAQAVDVEADRAVGAYYRNIEEFVRNYGPEHPLGKMARELLKGAFPDGLKAVVQQQFEDQLVAMERIVRLGQTEYVAEHSELHVTHWFERVVALTEQYRAELAASRHKPVTFAEVKEARRRCSRHGRRVITAVTFLFGEETEEDRLERNAILEPLTLQQRAVYDMQRARRRVTDIDPNTGVEVDSDALEIDEVEDDEVSVL